MKIIIIMLVLVGFLMPVLANTEKDVVEIVETFLKIEGPFTVDLLSGGCSGSKIYKVDNAHEAYVIRFWNPRWSEWFLQDFMCQNIASEAGYGPKIFYGNIETMMTVMEYLKGESLPEDYIGGLATLLKKIHTGPVIPTGVNKSQNYDESIREIITIAPQFHRIKQIKEEVFAAVEPGSTLTPCHRDLHPGNIIYSRNQFFAIDYTWAGMDDPFYDLANIAVFNCKTTEEETKLLGDYLGRLPMPEELARLCLFQTLVKLFYGLELLQVAVEEKVEAIPLWVSPKKYLDFCKYAEGGLSQSNLLEISVSFLCDAMMDSQTEAYLKNLDLLSTSLVDSL